MSEKIGSFTAKITVKGTKPSPDEGGATFVEPNNNNLQQAIAVAVQEEYQLDNGVQLRDVEVTVTVEDTMDDK